MAKIYYVGDWAIMTGPVYAETPFNYAHKGLELYNYGRWLTEALSLRGWNYVESVSAWDFYKLGPGEYERILDEFDVLIFSDVEAKTFQLAPQFFDREKFGEEVMTYPDRIRLTVEAIEAGKGVMFLGGWLSFTGEMGKGGWNRTRLWEVLPVTCLDYEDLVESTEGYTAILTGEVKATVPANPFASLDLESFPPILGYNKTLPRQDCPVMMSVKETGDPLVAAGQFGLGRTLAYMSDPAPHWGLNFVYWEHYAEFWLRCLSLVLPKGA